MTKLERYATVTHTIRGGSSLSAKEKAAARSVFLEAAKSGDKKLMRNGSALKKGDTASARGRVKFSLGHDAALKQRR